MRRRTFLLGMSLLPISHSFAQSDSDASLVAAIAPLESNTADFSQSWELVSGDDTILVAADNDIPDGYAESFGNEQFSKFADIASFFQKVTGDDFINFFNSQIAGKGFWAGKRIGGVGVQDNFAAYWKTVLATGPITAMHFIAYMSVFINEIEGNLVSKTEGFGSKGHPGIAYLFDTVAMSSANGRRWRKKSYNANRTLLDLLNDDLFLSSRKDLRFAQDLQQTNDPIWAGDAYPQSTFPTSGDIATTGIILEGDFFKFRGRGLIQTTWRSNYERLAQYVTQNSNASAAVAAFHNRLPGLSPGDMCTVSTNSDWDKLFADPERAVLAAAVRIHAKAGKYLPLAVTSADLNGGSTGSIRVMGDRIGGGGYGGNLKARVRQICMAIGIP